MAILHVVTYSTYKSSFYHNYIEKNNDNAHPPNNEKNHSTKFSIKINKKNSVFSFIDSIKTIP